MQHQILSGITVDDLLDDWGRYCRGRGVELGAAEGEGTICVLVVSEGKECRLHFAGSVLTSAGELIQSYLEHLRQRHPEISAFAVEEEAEAREKSMLDETVALIYQ